MNWQHPDSLRKVLDTVFAAPEYKWVQRADPFTVIKHAWAAIKHWWQNLQGSHPLGFRIVLLVLALLMLGIVVHAAARFFGSVRAADQPAADLARGAVPRDQHWYRNEADRLANAGCYTEAIQVDFLALVLAFDARSVVRFHPSKTPGEYARESRLAPRAREDFRDLVQRLYRYAFARSPCGAAEFADWRARAAPERYASAN